MQSAQAGGKFRMIGGQVVDRFGKVQPRLYLESLVHPFHLSGVGVDKHGKVDMVCQSLEILQLAFLLLQMFLVMLQSLFHNLHHVLRNLVVLFLQRSSGGEEIGIAHRPDKLLEQPVAALHQAEQVIALDQYQGRRDDGGDVKPESDK